MSQCRRLVSEFVVLILASGTSQVSNTITLLTAGPRSISLASSGVVWNAWHQARTNLFQTPRVSRPGIRCPSW